MRATRKFSIHVLLVLIVMMSAVGCKSSKKATEAAAQEKARQEQESIRNAEAAKRQAEAAAEQARLAAEEARRQAQAASTPSVDTRTRVTQYFEAISQSSSDASANKSIDEALLLFASHDTPVLIVINEYGTQKDYDRPTNIRDYLNYLKDQKKNMNSISEVKVDNTTGKITELELRKN